MPLDKSLMLTNAKSVEKQLRTESHALSNLQLRDCSAAGPSAGFSNEIGLKGVSDLHDQVFNNEIEPLNFDNIDQEVAEPID